MRTESRFDTDLAGETVALILAGGNGTRLGELTRWQCKPAIPFAGSFRNIDFTLSNCVNSGVRRIAVLTQYKAQSLINHISAGWSFLARPLGEFVELWPAQQRLHDSWYVGTADAVHQNLDLLLAQRSRYTLVLAGDHVYKMNYRRLLEQHASTGADVTVACVPVPIEESAGFGVLGVDERQRVRSFIEKPQPSSLGLSGPRTVLASMGVYVFNTSYLEQQLRRDAGEESSTHDFGRDILPRAVRDHQVAAYSFVDADGAPGYWRDVGTLDAYWQAHMELLAPEPPMELYDPAWPILTLPEQLPPAKLLYAPGRHGFVANSLLAGGVVVRGATVTNSVLAGNVRVAEGTLLDEAVVLPGARIGANCRLRRVIVDAEVEIPDGISLGWQPASPVETMRTGGRVTLLSQNWSPPGDDEMRSVA
ncbi:MAG TPA: glucose-1-phosphate adenylyltransferase [Steroidobacteraceae bacterium]|nr:glucose-1-phosphate adenylyltransferase [Steroidobacteraceae bacterium]